MLRKSHVGPFVLGSSMLGKISHTWLVTMVGVIFSLESHGTSVHYSSCLCVIVFGLFF